MMELSGEIALILICGLFAAILLTKGKIKDLEKRIKDLENALRDK